MLYAYGHLHLKNISTDTFIGIVDNPNNFRRYSGVARDINRLGLSGETDISGISFENEWMIIQFGRGRQVGAWK